MIYREHPEVGAILHVHAWVDGVDATTVNFRAVRPSRRIGGELVREAPIGDAIIGLKNTGSRSPGRTWTRFFERVERTSSGTSRCPEGSLEAGAGRGQLVVRRRLA